MHRALRPILCDFFGDPAEREKARRWHDLAAARAELAKLLTESRALILPIPRRLIEAMLGWFNDIEDGDKVSLACRTELEDRIQRMIDCLDYLDSDSDLEVEPPENEAGSEEESMCEPAH